METVVHTALTSSDYKTIITQGITYSEYKQNFQAEMQAGTNSPYAAYLPINWQRMMRIEKTVRLSEEIVTALKTIQQPIHWLVITEHWCGDAAQTLPVIEAIANASQGKINLRFVYRDQNLELMDAHLTGTSRSIPKLIQLDQDYNITGSWGPRPSIAQKMVLELKANPDTAKNYSETLHKWYAADKQQSIQTELYEVVSSK